MRLLPAVQALVPFALPGVSNAVEEPKYQVMRDLGGVELRQYAPYIVAEVLVAGPAQAAGNQAFPMLAGYIFGKNKGKRKFAMSAPVTQSATPARLAMTAPVTQAAADGGFTVQFVLPKEITLATAPEPLDARVHLRAMPAQQLAAIKFSGFWSESNYLEHVAKLTAALREAQLGWSGVPVYSRYNAPWTPWFLRRNEIWLTLD